MEDGVQKALEMCIFGALSVSLVASISAERLLWQIIQIQIPTAQHPFSTLNFLLRETFPKAWLDVQKCANYDNMWKRKAQSASRCLEKCILGW